MRQRLDIQAIHDECLTRNQCQALNLSIEFSFNFDKQRFDLIKKMEESMKTIVTAFALTCGVYAQASDFQGTPLEARMLRAENGQLFSVRANQVWDGGPWGFFKMYMTKVEAVVYDNNDYKDVSVVFVSQCRNYNGDRFSAYLSCKADYDPAYDRFVAKLQRDKCHSDEPEYHTNFNFYGKYGWYVKGRTGYYYGQQCEPQVAVVADGKWLRDPITNSNNFGLSFDYQYSEDANPNLQ